MCVYWKINFRVFQRCFGLILRKLGGQQDLQTNSQYIVESGIPRLEANQVAYHLALENPIIYKVQMMMVSY